MIYIYAPDAILHDTCMRINYAGDLVPRRWAYPLPTPLLICKIAVTMCTEAVTRNLV